jgi:hypothetical protein
LMVGVGVGNASAMSVASDSEVGLGDPRPNFGNLNTSVFDANYRANDLGLTPLDSVFYYQDKLAGYAPFTVKVAPSSPSPNLGRSSLLFFHRHATNHENPSSAVFQVTSYRTVDGSPRFDTSPPATSEPKTLAMMLAGFGMVSLIARRRIVA